MWCITTSATVVDITYAVEITINRTMIMTKTPGVYFVFGVVGVDQAHESVAHAIEFVLAC